MKKFFKRSIILQVVILIFTALLLGGCGSSSEETKDAGNNPSNTNAEPWKIGFVSPLSGPAATIGQLELEAIKIGLEEINAEGGIHGRKLELIVEDDQTNPSNTVVAVKKLIQDKKIDILIGPSLTNMALPAIPIVEENEIPNINIGAGRQIIDPVRKWVFKLPHTDTLIVEKQLEFLSKKLGIKKLAILHQDDATGVSGQKQLKSMAAQYGIEVVIVEKFNGADTDMTAQLTKISASKAEAVAMHGVSEPVGIIAKNAQQLGFKLPMISNHGSVSNHLIEVAGKAAEGMYFVGTKSIVGKYLPDNDPVKANYETIMKSLKKPFDIFHGNGYDSIYLAAEALKRAGKDASNTQIRDALESLNNFQLLNAAYTFTPESHDGPKVDSLIILKVENSEFKPAE